MGRRHLPLVTLAVLAAVALGACGESEDEEPSATAPAPAARDLENTDLKPEIPKPTGAPPRRLEKMDIVKGKGTPAKPGDTVIVHYAGVSFSTGDEFDASWNAGQPFTFPLGAGEVIAGWDKGVAGMRKGGRRQLTIPPELAYGAEGSPPVIGPNETLVFVIDMLDIR